MSENSIDQMINMTIKDELNMADDFCIGDIRIRYSYAIAQDVNVELMAKQEA